MVIYNPITYCEKMSLNPKTSILKSLILGSLLILATQPLVYCNYPQTYLQLYYRDWNCIIVVNQLTTHLFTHGDSKSKPQVISSQIFYLKQDTRSLVPTLYLFQHFPTIFFH